MQGGGGGPALWEGPPPPKPYCQVRWTDLDIAVNRCTFSALPYLLLPPLLLLPLLRVRKATKRQGT